VLGNAYGSWLLTVLFSVRANRIRVISARLMSRKGNCMKKKIKPVPKFRKEQDEREFWSTHDTTDYFDFSKLNRVEIEFDRGIEAR